MYDWHEMAEIVARKLVEKGQERILQRIFDGVTSNLTLDVSDYKESDEHKLLHLVWRKFPRKRSPAYGQRTNTSDFIQTTEMTNISGPTLTTVDPNVCLFTTPVHSTKPNLGNFEVDESASSSDSGSNPDPSRMADMAAHKWTSSDRSFPSTDLATREMSSFHFPAKGPASKSRTFETIELSNQYVCVEQIRVAQIEDDSWTLKTKTKEVPR